MARSVANLLLQAKELHLAWSSSKTEKDRLRYRKCLEKIRTLIDDMLRKAEPNNPTI